MKPVLASDKYMQPVPLKTRNPTPGKVAQQTPGKGAKLGFHSLKRENYAVPQEVVDQEFARLSGGSSVENSLMLIAKFEATQGDLKASQEGVVKTTDTLTDMVARLAAMEKADRRVVLSDGRYGTTRDALQEARAKVAAMVSDFEDFGFVRSKMLRALGDWFTKAEKNAAKLARAEDMLERRERGETVHEDSAEDPKDAFDALTFVRDLKQMQVKCQLSIHDLIHNDLHRKIHDMLDEAVQDQMDETVKKMATEDRLREEMASVGRALEVAQARIEEVEQTMTQSRDMMAQACAQKEQLCEDNDFLAKQLASERAQKEALALTAEDQGKALRHALLEAEDQGKLKKEAERLRRSAAAEQLAALEKGKENTALRIEMKRLEIGLAQARGQADGSTSSQRGLEQAVRELTLELAKRTRELDQMRSLEQKHMQEQQRKTEMEQERGEALQASGTALQESYRLSCMRIALLEGQLAEASDSQQELQARHEADAAELLEAHAVAHAAAVRQAHASREMHEAHGEDLQAHATTHENRASAHASTRPAAAPAAAAPAAAAPAAAAPAAGGAKKGRKGKKKKAGAGAGAVEEEEEEAEEEGGGGVRRRRRPRPSPRQTTTTTTTSPRHTRARHPLRGARTS
jgi:hypothetical protein